MGFNDLKFEWSWLRFTLFDMEIDSSIILETENGDDKLEYGELKNIKYSKPRRTLTAKANINGKYSYLCLGIPEDRQHDDCYIIDVEDSIEFILIENNGDNFDDVIKSGNMGYSKEDLEFPVFIICYISTDAFNHIENFLLNSTEFTISIAKKGWCWTGSIGDSYYYIDMENREKVELNSITANKKIPDLKNKNIVKEDIKEDDKLEIENYNINIMNKISQISDNMIYIKIALWVIALGVILNILIGT